MENREIATKPDPFQIMDRLDDALIIEELEGRLPGILTYHFNDGKQEVWGLSKAGVDECKTELAKKGEVLRELEAHWDDKEEEAFFHVKVGRYVISKEGQEILLDTALGFKRQPKYYSGGKLNPFWYEQGAIKACRNACMRLIPKTIQQAIIEYAKQKGKVKDIKKDNHSVPKQSPKEEKSPEPDKGERSFDSLKYKLENSQWKDLDEVHGWWNKQKEALQGCSVGQQRILLALYDKACSKFK